MGIISNYDLICIFCVYGSQLRTPFVTEKNLRLPSGKYMCYFMSITYFKNTQTYFMYEPMDERRDISPCSI